MSRVADGRELYVEAFRAGYALPAFNVCNLEMALGVLEAAELEQAPVILQTYPGDLEHAGVGVEEHAGVAVLSAGLLAAIDRVQVPVALHLDHGDAYNRLAECLSAGYCSVMFDGSSSSLEENAQKTQEAAELAHYHHAALEGELGRFGGPQGEVVFTDAAEAERFVRESSVDTLAVSVGSEHHQQSRLDLPQLRAIAGRTEHPLVLHGGSGIHPEDVRAALDCGVVKINIGKALSEATCKGAARVIQAGGDHYEMLAAIKDEVREAAREKIRLMQPRDRILL